jgi:hypothetical protein
MDTGQRLDAAAQVIGGTFSVTQLRKDSDSRRRHFPGQTSRCVGMFRECTVDLGPVADFVVGHFVPHSTAFSLKLAKSAFMLGTGRSDFVRRAQRRQAPTRLPRGVVSNGIHRAATVVGVRHLAASRVSAHAIGHVSENGSVSASRVTAESVFLHLVGCGLKTLSMRFNLG